MPPHDTYIETHLGGGAVLRNKRPARLSVGVDVDPHVISAASAWKIPGLTLCQADAVGFLQSYNFDSGELIYADPPYVRSTKAYRRYYRHEYSDEDHKNLLEILLEINCAVMISGYSCDLYENALHDWERRELLNITHAGPRWETIWANFSFSPDLHDYSKIGGTFRERERIKRKAARWARKLELMPPLEQRAILSALLRSSLVCSEFADRILRNSRRSPGP
jgi:DNA adenine methylase